MRRQLPCKLTSYAADTGNKHRFALHIFGYHIDIDAENLSFQKIFDIDVADLLYADLTVCDLIKPGKLLDLAACMRAYLDDLSFRLMRYRRYRNDYFLNAVLLGSLHDLITSADDRNAEHTSVLL